MDLGNSAAPKRRRGQELEDALLDAAWDELVANGYAGFTFDAVAERAGTSRPVLYRRWSGREELVMAAVRHRDAGTVRTVPDTGSLRGDVIEILATANETRLSFAAVFSVQLGAFYQETGTTPADMRRELLGNRPTSMDAVIRRAVERGEVDPARLTPRIAALPFDLVRLELLMTLKAVPLATIHSIVDEIFMPLVRKE